MSLATNHDWPSGHHTFGDWKSPPMNLQGVGARIETFDEFAFSPRTLDDGTLFKTAPSALRSLRHEPPAVPQSSTFE